MIKITKDIINKPYFKEIGSIVCNYPHGTANPIKTKEIFEENKKSVEYKIIGYNNNRDVINLVSTRPTDSLGVSRLNILRLDLSSGFWWYDPFKDVSDEVEILFDKYLNQAI
jgi:hypothetical protein